MSRRRFLRSLAAAPLLPTALSQAPTPPSPAPAAPSPPPTIPAPATPVPSPSPSPPGPVAQALGEVVRIRYGSQLEEADLAEVRKGIEGNLQAADRLRKAVKLANGDEPINLFHPRLPPPPPPPVVRRRRR
jgi:hypothetical protein